MLCLANVAATGSVMGRIRSSFVLTPSKCWHALLHVLSLFTPEQWHASTKSLVGNDRSDSLKHSKTL